MRAQTILALAAPMLTAACGGGGGSNSATGQLGFNAAWAGANLMQENGGELLELFMSDANLSGACSNSSGGNPPTGNVQLLIIGIATLGSKVAPGDFPIYDINGADPPPSVTKLSVAQLGTVSASSSTIEGTAVSGTVTLSSTGDNGSTGTFDMTMTLPDGGSGGKLTGSFKADPCALPR